MNQKRKLNKRNFKKNLKNKKNFLNKCKQNVKFKPVFSQNGKGYIRIFKSNPLQRGFGSIPQSGHGIGGFLKSAFQKFALPALKSAGKYAASRAFDATKQIVTDVASNNTSLKDAIKKQAKSELNLIKDKAKNKILDTVKQKVINKGKQNKTRISSKGKAKASKPSGKKKQVKRTKKQK